MIELNNIKDEVSYQMGVNLNQYKKIEYMFPRGHATAYVIMAVRIAWFEVYYPKEFYTAFLNRKADDFKLYTMFKPVEELKTRRELLEKQGKLNPKEKQELFLYELLIEMHYRGIELEMVDLYQSNAKSFEINKETTLQTKTNNDKINTSKPNSTSKKVVTSSAKTN